mgnify:CR=1 FL=1
MAASDKGALWADIQKKGGNNKPVKETESASIVQAKTFGAWQLFLTHNLRLSLTLALQAKSTKVSS